MNLKSVLTTLGEPNCHDAVSHRWDASEAASQDEIPPFLKPETFKVSLRFGRFDSTIDAEVEETARQIAADSALLRLARHAHYLLYQEPGYRRFREWPDLESALPGRGGVFYLLLSLDAIPRVRKVHRKRGIPESVTRDTCLDVRIGSDRYRSITGGLPGMERRLMTWHRTLASGKLHRLGRMQYVLRSFGSKLLAYRNLNTQRVLALSESGISYDNNGHVASPGEWTAQLVDDGSEVTGSPISPLGMALKKEVTLPLDRWQRVLSGDESVLQMHIPEGEPLTLDRCRDSMQQALDYFPRYYPDLEFRAFSCNSWILNTQLEEMLSPESNLVKHQRELYLFPCRSSGKAGLYFIFYQDEVDTETAPRDTSLKRAILDHLSQGKPLRSGGMFVLKEDVPHFGTQYYRSQWKDP